MSLKNLKLQQLGPIQNSDVTFGDLTVFVGPQATGKSIFLQLVKLLIDIGYIRKQFKHFNIEWKGSLANFLALYFGEGMAGLYDYEKTQIIWDGKKIHLESFISSGTQGGRDIERLFYIPAQRVMSLREGLTRPFTDFQTGDPFVLREFGQKLHDLTQSEFVSMTDLFPKPNRLKKEFADLISQSIFGDFELRTDTSQLKRRIVLSDPTGKTNLPYLVWSAGQREFVPLLLGLYWLLPPNGLRRRANVQWVVIEEPEMGLHPKAISAVLAVLLDLLYRGYRVNLSTHSPHVLEVVWALRILQENKGKPEDVLDILGLSSYEELRNFAEKMLKKKLRVYFFKQEGQVRDISTLDPGADQTDEAGWGGLTEFSGNIDEIVARVVNRAE